ncbi:hypothetical protein GCM10027053_51640 [Intrasporangium mesophilum]
MSPRPAFTHDELYGEGHRPSIARVGAHWLPSCSCSLRCRRADDKGGPRHYEDALADAAYNLIFAQHGWDILAEECEPAC